ncbi:MAG: hypothetical protein H7X95_09250 [Deltaproteobacteria bacterium]|nr:hypothetical protein [Deltaproteobacteria bacterium]
MTRTTALACTGIVVATLLFDGAASAAEGAVADASDVAKPLTTEPEAGGTHHRVSTPAGPVHVFLPAGYDRRSAGIVVYVHGLYVHVDDAWRDHGLAQQFAASRRNALFIAPEAPSASNEKPVWAHLQRLIGSTLRRAHLQRPRGPLTVAGHSAAYRTIVPWLKERSLHNIILIDAMYGNQRDFRAWLKSRPGNRMTLVVRGTGKWADPFIRSLPFAKSVRRIPDSIEELSRPQRNARLLALRSQYGHNELITEGKVLPVLLRRTPLLSLPLRGKATRPNLKRRSVR